MSELPAWVDPAQMQLDTRVDAHGRWVSGPANDAAVPKPVDAQPRDIVVRDDTLRSGGNTPGVYASVDRPLLAAVNSHEIMRRRFMQWRELACLQPAI